MFPVPQRPGNNSTGRAARVVWNREGPHNWPQPSQRCRKTRGREPSFQRAPDTCGHLRALFPTISVPLAPTQDPTCPPGHGNASSPPWAEGESGVCPQRVEKAGLGRFGGGETPLGPLQVGLFWLGTFWDSQRGRRLADTHGQVETSRKDMLSSLSTIPAGILGPAPGT